VGRWTYPRFGVSLLLEELGELLDELLLGLVHLGFAAFDEEVDDLD